MEERTFDRSDAVPQFVEEAREHLDNINSMLVSLEEELNVEVVDRLLRTAHNLKGESKMMMFEKLGNLIHCFEDAVRILKEAPDPETLSGLFPALFETHDMAGRVVELVDLLGNDDMDGIEDQRRRLESLAGPAAAPANNAPRPPDPPAPAQDPTPRPAAPEPAPEYLFDEIDPEVWDTAIDEIGEHSNQLNVNLIQLEKTPQDTELIKDIFRSMHTIKGTTGILGLRLMNTLSHRMENVLSEIRDGNMAVTGDIMDIFFRGMDYLVQFLEAAKAREPVTGGIDSLLTDLEAILQGESPSIAPDTMITEPEPEPEPEPTKTPEPKQPAPPAAAQKAPAPSPAPSPAPKTPQRTEALRVNIQKLDNLMNSIEGLVMDKITLDEQLGALQGMTDQISASRSNLIKLFRKMHEIWDNREDRIMTAAQAQDMADLINEEIGEASQDINHELTSLDIAGSELAELSEALYQSMNRIGRVSTDLQEGIMLARMVPVSTVFGKFRRTVRDLSKQSGKQVQFLVTGEDTELDKRVIEEISDPLMHILRNSVDHGIESPAQRTQAGKDPQGTLSLNAYYESNDVVIEIRDDGKGIDPARISAKAVERGLIDEEQLREMTQQEILSLIFTPGFSTAEQVTEISGRGVGMDVVSTNIAGLNGRIELDSTVGLGTRIKIKIPLTLAIIQALMVNQNEFTFAVPLAVVVETIKMTADQIETVEGREVVSVREKTIPVIRLEDVLDLPPTPRKAETTADSEYEASLPIVIVAAEDGLYGLLVDELMGKREIVIKSLGYPLERLPHIMGATLLGDGRVVPILDVPDIAAAAIRRSEHRRRRTDEPDADPRRTHAYTVETETRRAAAILIIDDSQSFAMMLKRNLEDYGFAADWAQDGLEGIQFIEAREYNLAIVDMEMPRMNGIEVLKHVRAGETNKDLPMIMATTRGEKADVEQALAAGANDYLVKPFDKKTLFNAMSRLITF